MNQSLSSRLTHSGLYKASVYSLSLVLIPLALDFGQDVIQGSQFWGDGVDLDPDPVRMCPGDSGSLHALPVSQDMRVTPDGAWKSGLQRVGLNGHLTREGEAGIPRLTGGLLQLALQEFVPSLQLMDFGEEAAEPQVEGLEHMYVGSQVVAQSSGHRVRWRTAHHTAQKALSKQQRRTHAFIQNQCAFSQFKSFRFSLKLVCLLLKRKKPSSIERNQAMRSLSVYPSRTRHVLHGNGEECRSTLCVCQLIPETPGHLEICDSSQ